MLVMRLSTFIFLCIFSVSHVNAKTDPTPGKILGTGHETAPDWFKESFLDFREDAAEAGESGKHMLVFADLNGCPYCSQMLKDNFKTAEKDGGNMEFIKANFDNIQINIKGSRDIAFNEDTDVTELELAKALNIQYTPTILFMDANNKVVTRINGYRSPREFKQVLNYVKEKAYNTTDFPNYRATNLKDKVYTLLPNKHFTDITDFKKAASAEKPLAILFEDTTCDECDRFHKENLNIPETEKLMQAYNFVRLDALSDKEIIDTQGNKTTAAKWLKKEGISYRPALLLFAEGEEKARVTGLLKSFHIQQLLTYVAKKKYNEYEDWLAFGKVYSEEILNSGKDIDLWK